MSIVGKLLGEAGATAARGLLDGIGDLGLKVRSMITGEPDPAKKAELEALAIQADALLNQGQMEINKIEAQSTRLFVAGWRPFIGWVCGVAIGWNMVAYPFVTWAMAIWVPQHPVPPALSLVDLYPVVISMLGLGVYRTYEKAKGVSNDH